MTFLEGLPDSYDIDSSIFFQALGCWLGMISAEMEFGPDSFGLFSLKILSAFDRSSGSFRWVFFYEKGYCRSTWALPSGLGQAFRAKVYCIWSIFFQDLNWAKYLVCWWVSGYVFPTVTVQCWRSHTETEWSADPFGAVAMLFECTCRRERDRPWGVRFRTSRIWNYRTRRFGRPRRATSRAICKLSNSAGIAKSYGS